MAKIIKVTNKYSNEEGYVQSVSKTEGHFVNTFEIAEAKTFKRECDVARALNTLEAIGECENNDFEIVDR